MQKFKEFLTEENHIQQVIVEMMLIEDTDIEQLNEMFEQENSVIEEGIQNIVKDLIHVKKGKGLIQYLKNTSVGVAKLIVALVKGDTETAKEIAKSVKKQDVLDFILKLDQATMHIITGPIHSLEAITGWHIWANISKAKEVSVKIVDKIKQAIQTIKQNLSNVVNNPRKRSHYTKFLDNMDKTVSGEVT